MIIVSQKGPRPFSALAGSGISRQTFHSYTIPYPHATSSSSPSPVLTVNGLLIGEDPEPAPRSPNELMCVN
jgi:hypothetical protein